LTQRAVYEFLERGLLPDHLSRLNAANRERCDAMLKALAQHMGDKATWTRPEGGLFVWLTLHDTSVDTWALLNESIDTQRVAYVPGGAFAVAGRDAARHTMRLNFSAVTPEYIHDGIQRLAKLVN
jgi:2-aminoadipate transaminase